MKPDGEFELLTDKHGFVIGGISGISQTAYEIRMEKGSKIFVYTDGLAEAQNSEGEFFTVEKVLHELNLYKEGNSMEIIDGITASIEAFEGGAPQFDDLTMLCLVYNGQ